MSQPQGRERTPIAIVGMAGTFAGSKDLASYWDNILGEVDCITDVPATHFDIADYYDADPKAPDKTYSKRGGFLPGIDFNPLEFGLPPNILELTDVAQLLSLAVASRALADAGYAKENPHAERTGVVLGVSALGLLGPLSHRLQYPIWERVLRARRVPEAEIGAIVEAIKSAYVEWREDAFPGYLSNVVPGRIANRLNLGGINCSVDAACASSMASLQFAMHELRSGGVDVMLAGGVDTNNTPMGFVSFSKTPAFTTHDRMRPFDAASDGMLIGEGLGILVLRRLEEAERDGQRIYAVIRGVGASSDGRFSSIYAPRQAGQELALRRAYEEAGVPASTIGLVEAHGTGTPTGDPTEIAALQAVIGTSGAESIALGSVKSQIGHTKVAAGVASLIKAALALHEKVLPATINVAKPHAKVAAPFYVNTKTRPWFAKGIRRAGVSSFGFGGTNFHAVLEEHVTGRDDGVRAKPTPYALFVTAADPTALAAQCTTLAAELRGETGARRFRDLVDASKTLQIPREHARAGFLALDPAEAADRLDEAAALAAIPSGAPKVGSKVHVRAGAFEGASRVAVLFPGQGSQSVDMGCALVTHFPPVRAAFEKMDALRVARGLPAITDVVFPPPVFEKADKDAQTERLRATNHAQAAIGTLNLGMYELLRRWGCTPEFVAGHSLGELSALQAGGVLDEAAYLSLLIARGEAMARPPDSGIDAGTLLAVGGDTAMLEEFVKDRPGVTVANRNSRSQLVVAGSKDDLTALKAELAALGVTATLLPVSGAFHSHRVAHAQAPFAKALEDVRFSSPAITTFANATAAPYPADGDAARTQLGEQVLKPVEFRREIEAMHDAGARVFIECGPGRVLSGLVSNILDGRPHLAIALNRTKGADDDLSLRDAFVQLRVAGVALGVLDAWQAPPDVPEARRGNVVRLNGSPYKSERTKLAFEHATEPVPEKPMTTNERPLPPAKASPPIGDPTAQAHFRFLEHMEECSGRSYDLAQQLFQLARDPSCSPAALAAVERAVSSYHALQIGAQQVHAQFLAQRGDVSRRPVASGFESLPEPIEYRAPAAAAARAPEPPELAGVAIAASSRNGMNGGHGAVAVNGAASSARVERPAAPVPKPAPVVARPAVVAPPVPKPPPPPAPKKVEPAPAAAAKPGAAQSADEIATLLLNVISEKTGYPRDTLDPSMDVDADLGIDSLKRVEIMAALEGRISKSLSGIDFSSFATKRKVIDIARFLAEMK